MPVSLTRVHTHELELAITALRLTTFLYCWFLERWNLMFCHVPSCRALVVEVQKGKRNGWKYRSFVVVLRRDTFYLILFYFLETVSCVFVPISRLQLFEQQKYCIPYSISYLARDHYEL